jgi:F-type H+-transporting ATPase subunit epsilon
MNSTAPTFQFELVSPERKLVSEPAWQVTLPGDMGDLGVRAGHMALVVSMRTGVVTIETSENGNKLRVFVVGGFADIGADHCTILAEQAFEVANLNLETLQQELKDLDDEMLVASDEFEKSKLSERQTLVRSMITAVQS